MCLQDFIKEVEQRIKQKLGDDYGVETRVIHKINNQTLHGIQIRQGGQKIIPCIYIDEYYEKYRKGDDTIEETADSIICTYRESTVTNSFDLSVFTDYSKACTRLHGRLLSREMNEAILTDYPYREFLDFVLLYFVEYDGFSDGATASIGISNQQLDVWGVTEEDLFEQMKKNMYADNDGELNSMSDIMQKYGMELEKEISAENPMYVLTNKKHLYGAVQILNDDMLKCAEEVLHGDFYILPSSIHETILIPKGEVPAEELGKMVYEVNELTVQEKERLSYHVYEYDSVTGQIAIAA